MFEQSSNSFYSLAGKPSKLWSDSQITHNYPSPNLSFSKEKRFKWSSIYWPQNNDLHPTKFKKLSEIAELANKVSKKIDQQEKNEVRMRQVKRSLSKGKSQLSTPRKEAQSVLSTKKAFKLSKLNEGIVNRLTQYQMNYQSTLRDKHGNRCNLYEDPQQIASKDPKGELKFMSKTTGFSSSRKVDLNLPHNYFPGPGTYEIKRYLAELDAKSEFYQPLNHKSSERSTQP